MKFSHSLAAAVLVALAPLTTLGANAPAGFIDFGKFDAAASGGEFVEVNINNNLINMVARMAHKGEPQVAEMLAGLKAIRVNVIGLKDDNRAEIEDRVRDIRAQLDNGGWERIVTAQQKKQDVGVYLKTRGPEAVEGIVVTVLDGKKQAVLVNIVGDIKPEKLALLGERFNIEPLKKFAPAPEEQAEDSEK